MICRAERARVSQSRPRTLNSIGKPRVELKPIWEMSWSDPRLPGIAFTVSRTTAMNSAWLKGRCRLGSTGRSPGSFMVMKTIPVLTSPPPNPPTAPEYLSTSGRPSRKVSIWRNTRSVASRLVHTGVWNRTRNRLMSWEGMNSLRRNRTMPRERTKNPTAASMTQARWWSAGFSQRR